MADEKTIARARPKAASRKAEGLAAAAVPARMRILASAEKLFAEQGFDGATVRQIALAADVPLALVNYHFGSKEGLYRAIFDLRAPTIVDQRLAGLALADMETDPDRRLELVVKALIVPMLKLRTTEKNAWFGRILAREVTDPNSANRGVIAELFDPIAHKVVEALSKCLPDRPTEHIHWGYQVMLGAMVFVMADTGRIVRLSEGRCDPDDHADASVHVVRLLIAALKYGTETASGRQTKSA